MYYVEIILRLLGWGTLCPLWLYFCWTVYQGTSEWSGLALCVPPVLMLVLASELRRKQMTISDD